MWEMFANLMTISADEVLGVLADFNGKVGGAQGLAKVQVILEGSAVDITARSFHTYPNPQDQTFATPITNWLHHFRIDTAAAFAIHAAGGAMLFYLKAIANDTDADPLILGPYRITLKTGLLAAPWGGAEAYDKIVYVDNTPAFVHSGDTYPDFVAALQAVKTFGSPLVILKNNGAHPQVNVPGFSMKPLATQLCTIAADPRTVTLGAWLGDGTGGIIGPGYDGLRLLGSLTKVDICQLNLGFGSIGTGNTTDDQTMVFEGCDIYQGVQTQSPSFAGWNGVTGAGALYNGIIAQSYFVNGHVVHRYFLETTLHDMTYGYSLSICRNVLGDKTFKFHSGVLGSYNPTCYRTGVYWNPNTVPLDAIDVWYTGAGTLATIQSSGGNTGAITLLTAKVDGSSVGTFTLNGTQTLTDVTAWIAGVADFHATLLATTPQTSRNAQNLWHGTVPTTPQSSALTTPVAISHSSGAPTRLQTIVDVHCDLFVWFSGAVMQNVILETPSGYGKRSGQVVFFAGAPAYLDFYFGGIETSDDASTLGAGYSSFVSLFNSRCSNVFMARSTQIGVGDSVLVQADFVGDAYCGFGDSVFQVLSIAPGATLNGLQLGGIATRTAAITPGGDANCIALGASTPNASIFNNALGTANYGYATGTKPDLTPATPTILREPVSGRIAGSRNVDGTRKLAS